MPMQHRGDWGLERQKLIWIGASKAESAPWMLYITWAPWRCWYCCSTLCIDLRENKGQELSGRRLSTFGWAVMSGAACGQGQNWEGDEPELQQPQHVSAEPGTALLADG